MKKIRLILLKNLYKSLYKIFKNTTYIKKYRHYSRKLKQLSIKTVSYNEFKKYIRKRKNLSLNNIVKLSEPLPFYVRSGEIWGWNEFYGISEIYKKYANIPADYKFKCILSHFVYFFNDYIHPKEGFVNLPSYLVTSNFAKENLMNKTDKHLYPTSLHIFYADDYYSECKFKNEKQKLGKNLLVFPLHSNECLEIYYETNNFINEILKIKEENSFDSVTICLYYHDVNIGLHKKFEGYGFNIVTAGHVMDTKFLSRLKTIIKFSDMTMSNAVGSHIFYSLGLNKSHYLINEKNYRLNNKYLSLTPEENKKIYDKLHLENTAIQKYEQVFGVYSEMLTKEMLELKEQICDEKAFKTPQEIKEIINETEKLYKQDDNYLKYSKKNSYIHYGF